jgi:hypothetical protein
MQYTAHAAGTPTAHQGGLLRNPLEQVPPRSRTHAPSGGAPPRSRGNTSLERAPPRSRAHSPSSRFRLARGYVPLRPGSATLEGAPHACAGPRTRAFNALTQAGRRYHAPGARASVPPHQLPREEPIPTTVGGTVQCGRCQSRDTARLLQYG